MMQMKAAWCVPVRLEGLRFIAMPIPHLSLLVFLSVSPAIKHEILSAGALSFEDSTEHTYVKVYRSAAPALRAKRSARTVRQD
jgi:hypothetical protein